MVWGTWDTAAAIHRIATKAAVRRRIGVVSRATAGSHRKLRSGLVDSLVGDWAGEILHQLKMPLAAPLDTTARVMQAVRRVRNLLVLRPSGSNQVQDKAGLGSTIRRVMKPA